jgi:transcriptional regulator with XRE-family HTH domain
MAKGVAPMTTYQAATPWIELESRCPLKHPYPAINYSPAPLEETGSTGIRGLLVDKLITTCGSGSWCDAAFSQLIHNVTRDYFSGDWVVTFISFGETAEKISPPTIAEKLTELRDAFGISMAALADILNASRASVYNWFESEPRSTDVIQRIETLHEVTRDWKTKNPYHYAPGRLMRQKLGDGPSMYERLCREKLNMDEIRSGIDHLLALMNKQQERMDRAKMRSAKVPANADSQEELLERLTGSVTAEK